MVYCVKPISAVPGAGAGIEPACGAPEVNATVSPPGGGVGVGVGVGVGPPTETTARIKRLVGAPSCFWIGPRYVAPLSLEKKPRCCCGGLVSNQTPTPACGFGDWKPTYRSPELIVGPLAIGKSTNAPLAATAGTVTF